MEPKKLFGKLDNRSDPIPAGRTANTCWAGPVQNECCRTLGGEACHCCWMGRVALCASVPALHEARVYLRCLQVCVCVCLLLTRVGQPKVLVQLDHLLMHSPAAKGVQLALQ